MSEPVAVRYDFDGHGYLYMDANSGSDWASRVKDCEFLYTHPMRELSDEEIIDLCVKQVEKLIAPTEPDYDSSQWNDTIQRAILEILNVKAVLKKASEK